MENWLDLNRKLWDNKVPLHVKSDFYRLEQFLQGESSLTKIETDGLASEVSGKKLLHLQCHFGMDTLSWGRLGAQVTGVDFSPKAIRQARKLARETGQKARFVESDIYSLKENLAGKFDIVFTSFGTIGWLPDLEKWADVIQHFLKKGGVFYIADFHPWLYLFDYESGDLIYDWFNTEPIVEQVAGTYADRYADLKDVEVGWNHSFEEILGALLGAGLRLEKMREFDCSPFNCFPKMVERAPGEFVWGKYAARKMPHVYSLRLRK